MVFNRKEHENEIIKRLAEYLSQNPGFLNKVCFLLTKEEAYFQKNFPFFLLSFKKFALLNCARHEFLFPLAESLLEPLISAKVSEDTIIEALTGYLNDKPELINQLAILLVTKEAHWRKEYLNFPKFYIAFGKFSLLNCAKYKFLDPFANSFCDVRYTMEFIERLLRSLKGRILDSPIPLGKWQVDSLKTGILNQLSVATHIGRQRIQDVFSGREEYFLQKFSEGELAFFNNCLKIFMSQS